ncbi:hypothetical protein V8C35DRAFT_306318, partial [Trichoderma chlorosporum]
MLLLLVYLLASHVSISAPVTKDDTAKFSTAKKKKKPARRLPWDRGLDCVRSPAAVTSGPSWHCSCSAACLLAASCPSLVSSSSWLKGPPPAQKGGVEACSTTTRAQCAHAVQPVHGASMVPCLASWPTIGGLWL